MIFALYVLLLLLSVYGSVNFHPLTPLGTSQLINNSTVYGALIVKDNKERSINHRHGYDLSIQLPFHTTEWSIINAKHCPHIINLGQNHRLERGLTLTHYNIWLDFLFFDNYVIETSKSKSLEQVRGSSYSSVSGSFVAYQNGSFYKNGNLVLDSDILVVLEEDVILSSSENFNSSLVAELTSMRENIDLLFLGQCESLKHSKSSFPTSSCSYAVTRSGARKLVDYYIPCRFSIDEQLEIMSRNHWITAKKSKSILFERKRINIPRSEFL
eukprot:gene8813-11901_t